MKRHPKSTHANSSVATNGQEVVSNPGNDLFQNSEIPGGSGGEMIKYETHMIDPNHNRQ